MHQEFLLLCLRSKSHTQSVRLVGSFAWGDEAHGVGCVCAGGNGACCVKRMHTGRKWGPPAPPASRFLDDVRMTPAAARNHPFLRRTPGIDYSKQSNSTNYVYLYPDPEVAPTEAPEPSYALPPLFWDDYQNPEQPPGEFPTIPTIELENPPMTDYDFVVEPPWWPNVLSFQLGFLRCNHKLSCVEWSFFFNLSFDDIFN